MDWDDAAAVLKIDKSDIPSLIDKFQMNYELCLAIQDIY